MCCFFLLVITMQERQESLGLICLYMNILTMISFDGIDTGTWGSIPVYFIVTMDKEYFIGELIKKI